MKRKHRPTAIGPVLALLAVTVAMTGLGSRNVDMAVAALTVVPVAAVVCGLSFVRSVIIEQRGQPRAQALRVVAVALFSSLAIIPFMH
jgi:ABC-type proline/glycine betaine transport system permease subunit